MLLQISLIAAVVVIVGLLVYLSSLLQQTKKMNQQLVITENQLHTEAEAQEHLRAEMAELRDKISHNVLTDSLTGLPSRKVFEDRFALVLNQSMRYQLTCSVMFLDLDGFKIINDALGHDAGDELLKEVADRLLSCVRQVDTMSRFAGDEFVFIFSQLAKAETAAYIAQRLIDAISQPFRVSGQELYLTASVGIAVFPMDGNDAKTLLKNADNALHQAKSRGRNMYQFYREEMHARSRRELILSSSLRGETIYQEFNIYYQPRINLETKKIVCMEALLHWQHPDFGLITLEEFSRLAENSGRVVEIGEWVLRHACEQLIKWREKDSYPQSIAVPLSLKQLENSHFIHKVSGILQEMKLDPGCLIFEIAETSLLIKIDLIEKMLHMMKHLGVQIAINSFGVGHLPLQHFKRLPIDIFKIDSTLIQDITVNKESEAIVKMVIALAKSLQATIVADGVESEKQKKLLLELGCVIMQGQLFSRPSLAKEFTEQKVHDMTVSV